MGLSSKKFSDLLLKDERYDALQQSITAYLEGEMEHLADFILLEEQSNTVLKAIPLADNQEGKELARSISTTDATLVKLRNTVGSFASDKSLKFEVIARWLNRGSPFQSVQANEDRLDIAFVLCYARARLKNYGAPLPRFTVQAFAILGDGMKVFIPPSIWHEFLWSNHPQPPL